MNVRFGAQRAALSLRILPLAFAASLSLGLAAHAQATHAPAAGPAAAMAAAAAAAAAQPIATSKLSENIWEVHGGTGGNVLVLVTSEGLVLVDGKYEDQYDALIKVIREKISTKPIKYLINTHFHSDHSGGNARFIPAGATVISSILGRDNIINKVQPGAPDSMTPANLTFEGGMRLFVGGQEVRLTHWGPSHTGSDVTVYFPRDRVIALGDLMTNFKLPPGIVLPPGPLDYNGGGSLAGWIATLDTLIATEGYDKVVPGHGSISTKADIATYRKELAEMRDHVTALLRDGTRSEADLRAQLKTEGWPELFIARAGHGLYLELKP